MADETKPVELPEAFARPGLPQPTSAGGTSEEKPKPDAGNPAGGVKPPSGKPASGLKSTGVPKLRLLAWVVPALGLVAGVAMYQQSPVLAAVMLGLAFLAGVVMLGAAIIRRIGGGRSGAAAASSRPGAPRSAPGGAAGRGRLGIRFPWSRSGAGAGGAAGRAVPGRGPGGPGGAAGASRPGGIRGLLSRGRGGSASPSGKPGGTSGVRSGAATGRPGSSAARPGTAGGTRPGAAAAGRPGAGSGAAGAAGAGAGVGAKKSVLPWRRNQGSTGAKSAAGRPTAGGTARPGVGGSSAGSKPGTTAGSTSAPAGRRGLLGRSGGSSSGGSAAGRGRSTAAGAAGATRTVRPGAAAGAAGTAAGSRGLFRRRTETKTGSGTPGSASSGSTPSRGDGASSARKTDEAGKPRTLRERLRGRRPANAGAAPAADGSVAESAEAAARPVGKAARSGRGTSAAADGSAERGRPRGRRARRERRENATSTENGSETGTTDEVADRRLRRAQERQHKAVERELAEHPVDEGGFPLVERTAARDIPVDDAGFPVHASGSATGAGGFPDRGFPANQPAVDATPLYEQRKRELDAARAEATRDREMNNLAAQVREAGQVTTKENDMTNVDTSQYTAMVDASTPQTYKATLNNAADAAHKDANTYADKATELRRDAANLEAKPGMAAQAPNLRREAGKADEVAQQRRGMAAAFRGKAESVAS